MTPILTLEYMTPFSFVQSMFVTAPKLFHFSPNVHAEKDQRQI
jgi:hypothetical protein